MSEISEIYSDSVLYYEDCLINTSNHLVEQFLDDNGIKDSIAKAFRLGFADDNKKSLLNHLLDKGYEEDLIISSGLIVRKSDNEIVDVYQNRLIFPIINEDNEVLGFGGRSFAKQTSRYLNVLNPHLVNDDSGMLFGINVVSGNDSQELILCEGYMDTIAMHIVGKKQTVTMIGDKVTANLIDRIRCSYKKVYLLYDSDTYGNRKAKEAFVKLKDAGIDSEILDISPYKDSYAYIKMTQES